MAQKIKEYLSNNADGIINLLESIGCHKVWEASSEEIRCAPPDGGNHTSISVNIQTCYAVFYKSTGNISTDIIGLVQHFKKRDFPNTLRYIRSILGLSKESYSKESRNPLEAFTKIRNRHRGIKSIKDLNIEEFDKSILSDFVILPHMSLFYEGIMPNTCDLFMVGFDPLKSRVVFPHFKYNNTEIILGITGRTTRSNEEIDMFEIPKYWNYIRGYKKGANLYGLSHSLNYIQDSELLVIFEGEKSVLKQFTMTKDNGYSCSVGGHELTDYQVQIILENTPLTTEIVVAFDKDVMEMTNDEGEHVGEMFLQSTCNKLSKYRKTSYIYDKYDLLDSKDSPVDKGYKIWNYLLKYRVKI